MRLMQLKHLPAEIIKINSDCLSCLETTDARDKKGESIPIPAKAHSHEWSSGWHRSVLPVEAKCVSVTWVFWGSSSLSSPHLFICKSWGGSSGVGGCGGTDSGTKAFTPSYPVFPLSLNVVNECASKASGRHFAGSGPISPSRELLLLQMLASIDTHPWVYVHKGKESLKKNPKKRPLNAQPEFISYNCGREGHSHIGLKNMSSLKTNEKQSNENLLSVL